MSERRGGNEEQFMYEEHAEAERFLRERGIVKLPEIRAHLDSFLSPEEKQKIEKMRAEQEPLQEAIRSLPQIQRLHELAQLNGKVNPETQVYDPAEPFVFTPTFHTRFSHSELIAEQAILAGLKANLNKDEIALALSGGWFHDVGHSAFSHGGDTLLVKYGRPEHEERTLETLDDKNVSEKLKAEGVEVEELKKVIKEKGKLGQLMKVLDTLSYLTLDSFSVQKPLFEDYGASLINDIRGLKEDGIEVGDAALWQQFLEDRAMMCKEVYYHPLNKIADEARRRLLEIAIQRGLISLEQVEKGGDHTIQSELQELCQPGSTHPIFAKPKNTPDMTDCKDLYEMSLGLMEGFDDWERAELDSKEEVQRYFNRNVKPGKNLEKAFVVEPFDYRNKKITIYTPDGEKRVLKAEKCELHPEDTKYIVISPKK